MREAGRHALARAVLSGREQLVLLRPLEDLLVLSVPAYVHQIRRPQVFPRPHSGAWSLAVTFQVEYRFGFRKC